MKNWEYIKVGNKYEWTTRNGELQYFDYSVPFGGHKKGSVEKTSRGYTGYKMNGPVIISKKEFATEEEAKRYVETGNKKVGNGSVAYNKLETEIRYAISEASVASKILSGNFSATNIISALSHCKQCCDNAIKLAQEYDKELQAKK